MNSLLIELLEETLHDTWIIIPVLFLMNLLLEYMESSTRLALSFSKLLKRYGVVLGAFLGLLPQCGFSIAACLLYIRNQIGFGTLLAIFISISDEAFLVLISEPQGWGPLLLLSLIKLVLAIAAGGLYDAIRKPHLSDYTEAQSADKARLSMVMVKTSLLKTLRIFLLIFGSTFVIMFAVHLLGLERVSELLLSGSSLQPLIAALIGLIPSCSISVVLCQLFLLGQLSFASLLAGLIANAGFGLIYLFLNAKSRRICLKMIALLFIWALIGSYGWELISIVFSI